MPTDRYGLPLSTSSASAAERYQEGMDRLLSYSLGADDAFRAALAADDRLALAHAGLALFTFFQGDGIAARASIARAGELVADATRRERQHVDALTAVMSGDTGRGLALIDEHLKEFPRDALLVNQASSSIGFSGRKDREAYRLAFLERLAPAFGDEWWFQSALSFTLHEVGRFEESRGLSERSLAQYPANANAIHNLAHVYFETLDLDGGTRFLDDWLGHYDPRAPFFCHLSWHHAMFALHRGDVSRALAIFERQIAASSTPRATVMDGAALLWRFMLYGCANGPLPWQPVAETARRVSRPGFVFGDIHAALAYAACGDTTALTTLIDNLKALDAKGHPIAGNLALPLVESAAAFASGDYEGALRRLEPIEPEIHRMGGSHAQWEIFEETMIASYLKVGRTADAARLLRRRIEGRRTPRDLTWLAEATA